EPKPLVTDAAKLSIALMDAGFEDFWKLYPRKTDKDDRAGLVDNRRVLDARQQVRVVGRAVGERDDPVDGEVGIAVGEVRRAERAQHDPLVGQEFAAAAFGPGLHREAEIEMPRAGLRVEHAGGAGAAVDVGHD